MADGSDGLLSIRVSFTDGTSGVYTVSVPEPTTVTLAAAGAGLLALRRRRRRA